jgi:hypothetical protein
MQSGNWGSTRKPIIKSGENRFEVWLNRMSRRLDENSTALAEAVKDLFCWM